MSYNNILVAKENSIATTINRPTKLNALNTVTIKELHQAFEELEKTMKHSNYFNRKR
jgi:enoyl-CoA hydratase